MRNLTKAELDAMEDKWRFVVDAPTRAIAANSLIHLKGMLREVENEIPPHFKNLINEFMKTAERASGQVKDKELLRHFALIDWMKFRNRVRE